MGNGGGRPRTTETMQRDAEALRLHCAGLNYDQIATQLGWAARAGAHHAVRRALRDSYRLPLANAVAVEEERLAMVTRALTKIINGHGRDVDVVNACVALVRASESRRRLLGLDQPVRRAIDVISETAIDAKIRELEGQLAAPR